LRGDMGQLKQQEPDSHVSESSGDSEAMDMSLEQPIEDEE